MVRMVIVCSLFCCYGFGRRPSQLINWSPGDAALRRRIEAHIAQCRAVTDFAAASVTLRVTGFAALLIPDVVRHDTLCGRLHACQRVVRYPIPRGCSLLCSPKEANGRQNAFWTSCPRSAVTHP